MKILVFFGNWKTVLSTFSIGDFGMQRDEFFRMLATQGRAVTFGDVTLATDYTAILPDEVNVESYFSRRVPLRLPVVSAAMDSVTEEDMAIAMALAGGIGVIHRAMAPERQAAMVAKTKHHLHGFISAPKTVQEIQSIAEVLRWREEKGYSFHTFPVLNADSRLVGVLTRSDFEFCSNTHWLVRDVMTSAPIRGESDLRAKDALRLMEEHKKKVLPIVDEDGRLRGMYAWKDVKRILSQKTSTHNVDEDGRLRVAAAVGVGGDALVRLEKLLSEDVDAIVIDTAHGDSCLVLETIREIRKDSRFDAIDVIVGNVSEAHSVTRLLEAGADGIKVGQGPGSICTTRVVAGVGCPQLTAIYNCARVAGDVPVIADGGIQFSGDITKAIAAGASSVMMGSMFAGTDESPGDTVLYQGIKMKDYRGMGSLGAMVAGSAARYNQAGTESRKLVPEGIEARVPYKGYVGDVIHQLMGGLRAGMAYIGAETLTVLQQKSKFYLISAASVRESHPHDVTIVKDPPNYKSSY